MYTNFEMDHMRDTLRPLLEMRNICGYAAARNFRLLSNELVEYDQMKRELVMELGTPETKEGEPTDCWYIPPEKAEEYMQRMGVYGETRHDPKLMNVKWADAMGKLSGNEMLAVEWMLED